MSPADSPFAQLPAPGPHPATAELRAYAAGTLAPPDEHRIEAHLLDCERCADLVAGFAMTDAPTTDRAVAQLRTRLQARIGAAEPEPVAAPWAWPRLAAAAALLAVVGSGVWSWQQHETAPVPATTRIETPAPAASEPVASAPIVPAAPAGPQASTPAPAAAAPAAEAAPKTAKPADYAAVATAPSARRAASRPIRRPDELVRSATQGRVAANENLLADRTAAMVVADAEATQYSPVLADEKAAAPMKKSEVEVAANESKAVADDSAGGALSSMAPAKSARKAKAVAVEDAARVRNTPMPAAVAINPAPVGGTPAYRDYLRRQAGEFEPEKGHGMNGNVRIKFTVAADGKVSDLKVTRGLRDDYDAEALRIVCDGPAWQPGIAGGRRAPLPMEVTVPF